MTIRNAIDYVCFTAIRCNGTTLIAEVHRQIMKQRPYYVSRFIEEGISFYELLYEIATEIQGDGNHIGSCTENRFQYSGGSNNTMWNLHQEDLFDIIQCGFYNNSNERVSRKRYDQGIRTIMRELLSKDEKTRKKRYPGIGYMGCIHFIHISSLIGLIPLYCITYSEIADTNLGPGRFINRSFSRSSNDLLSVKECNDIFIQLHHDFREVWGSKITRSLLENVLCELWRSYTNTASNLKGKSSDVSSADVEIIMDDDNFIDGKTKDVYFYDERRKCIQNFYSIRMNGKGASDLNPVLVMKNSKLWGSTRLDENVSLTNWKDGTNQEYISWSESMEKRNLDTYLNIPPKLKKMMMLTDSNEY